MIRSNWRRLAGLRAMVDRKTRGVSCMEFAEHSEDRGDRCLASRVCAGVGVGGEGCVEVVAAEGGAVGEVMLIRAWIR